VEKFTDHIYSMENWIKQQFSGDPESYLHIKRMLYGDDFDEEEGGLREL
jgi:hypothetical protein